MKNATNLLYTGFVHNMEGKTGVSAAVLFLLFHEKLASGENVSFSLQYLKEISPLTLLYNF